MKELNYEFKVRDFNQTADNHSLKVIKVRESDFNFNLPGRGELVADALNSMTSSGSYYWNYITSLSPALKLKAIKTEVNNAMRKIILYQLKFWSRPKSWDTAIYVMNYKAINDYMTSEAKELFENHLS